MNKKHDKLLENIFVSTSFLDSFLFFSSSFEFKFPYPKNY